MVLNRSSGRRDFKPRDRAIVRETQAALVPLVGGMLASFDDPSPHDLPPRLRQVLCYLLEGNGDKQIASRMSLSVHTVNGYTKYIYRHFRVKGRAELLARWIQRGWGVQFRWEDG
jgi:DNA-binding NarL/FixJ family response regulator